LASTRPEHQQPLTVAGLLRQYAAGYVAQFRRQAAPQVQSTLAKLSLCRTAALGGHRFRCGSCDSECAVYNSCGDRHCPQCSGAKRADWLTSTAELLLPGIKYFQVVFTIPDRLSSLGLGNRPEIYDLLFHSAWQSLRDVIAEEQGFEAAAAMVLHTWNQKLEPHAHVHALVPGGGPALQGERRWLTSRRRQVRHCDGQYLVDADKLRLRFRETFLEGLKRLHRLGQLKLDGEWARLRDGSAFEVWLQPLETITWVAYIEPPPTKQSAPEQVLKYLARYLTGGPISDRRLISQENGTVTFRARTGRKTGGDPRDFEPLTLPGPEFVRRWSLHILPKGYVKTRRCGGYSNRHRQRYVSQCQALLRAAGIHPTPAETDTQLPDLADVCDADSTEPSCPTCGALLHCIAAQHRGHWFDIMNGPHRPGWYDDG
jgi:putative transposase/transposase-like zinc-binding protein